MKSSIVCLYQRINDYCQYTETNRFGVLRQSEPFGRGP